MAFDQDDIMALEGEKSERPRDTLVEGYVVDHGVVWKRHHSVPHSVGACLNLDGGAYDAGGAVRQPPKVSVTLSEYLSAASPNPDPSCDFGWFTPTASASSLLAADSQQVESSYPAPPSPSNPWIGGFPLWGDSLRVDSAAKTASLSLSPESVFGSGGSGGGRGETVRAVAEGGETPVPEPPASSQPQQQQQQQQQHAKQLLALPAEGRGLARGGGGGGGGGSDSGGSMGVRLLPVSQSRSTTTHLNSWHTLYANASEYGKLSSFGRSTLHLRRPSFLISTRNFPERPPTPKSWSQGRESSGGGGSSSNTNSRGTGSNVLRILPNGPLVGPSAHQAHQQQERDCGSREACQQQQQQTTAVVKPKSYSWAITEIRVRRATRHFPFPSEPPFAEYLVVVCIGRERLVAGWRRASDFEKLSQVARKAWMPKARVAWESLEQARRIYGGGPCNIPLVMRPRQLDASYLQNKARFLEEFLKQFFFEANSKEALLSFLDPKKPATMEI